MVRQARAKPDKVPTNQPKAGGAQAVEMPNIHTSKNSFIQRLAGGVRASDQKKKPFLTQRLREIGAFCGPYYANTGAGQPQPLNTIYSFVTILAPSLSTRTLQAEGSTWNPDPAMHRLARRLGLAVTWDLREMRAADTYAALIVDALFGGGIAKVSVDPAPPGDQADFADWRRDAGRAFLARVSPDAHVRDPDCTVREAAQFEGDRFAIVAEDAYEWYDAEELRRLEARSLRQRADRAEKLAQAGRHGDTEELYPQFELINLYLPREQLVVVLPSNPDDFHKFLFEADYVGPEEGPYEEMAFEKPPDSTEAISPVGQIMGIHHVLNTIARKIQSREENRKQVLGYAETHAKDAEGIVQAADGASVAMADPNKTKQFEFNGAAREQYEAVAFFADQQNRNGPNPELLGGLEANSKTLGQDQLKFGAASTRLGRMKEQAHSFGRRMVRRLAWHRWYHPAEEIALAAPVAGSTEMPVTWRPQGPDREAEFLEMNVDLDLHSIGPDNPEAQYERMLELIERAVMPLVNQAAAQGTEIDVAKLVEVLARKRNLKDVSQFFRPARPVQLQGQGGPGEQRTTNISMGQRGVAMPGGPQVARQAIEETV